MSTISNPLILLFIFFAIFVIIHIFRQRCFPNESERRRLNQLIKSIESSDLKPKRLINYSEQKILLNLNSWLQQDFPNRFYLFPQVPYGSFISCDDDDIFFTYQAKRCDFLITDKSFYPIIVIEYQGEGHYHDNTDLKDHLKQTCTEQANLHWVEFFPEDTDDSVRKTIRALLPDQ